MTEKLIVSPLNSKKNYSVMLDASPRLRVVYRPKVPIAKLTLRAQSMINRKFGDAGAWEYLANNVPSAMIVDQSVIGREGRKDVVTRWLEFHLDDLMVFRLRFDPVIECQPS